MNGPAAATIDAAVAQVRAGGLIAFPTETLWSLSCLPTPEAVEKLRSAKARPDAVPLALGVAAWADAGAAIEATAAAKRLADRFLPGPLSIVGTRIDDALAHLAPGHDSLSIRVPDHPTATAILEATGPLVMTSANRHGEPDPQTAAEVAGALAGAPVMVVPGVVGGVASTVVDTRGTKPLVLREGVISQAEVEAAWQ